MESPKRFEQALQWRQGSWQRSIYAVRPKGVRYLFPHTMLIDAVPVGNKSACSFRMSLSKLIFDLHLSSTRFRYLLPKTYICWYNQKNKMLYVRKAEKCPEKLVKNGKCVFGGYDGHPERLDIRGLSRVFLDLPIPKFLTNLHIHSRLTFFFSIGEYIGSIDFFDAKIFGLVQVVFWSTVTKQRLSYRSVMGPRRRLVPHSLVKAATSSYKKSRYVRISWDRTIRSVHQPRVQSRRFSRRFRMKR